jgi:hypothetical protein
MWRVLKIPLKLSDKKLLNPAWLIKGDREGVKFSI